MTDKRIKALRVVTTVHKHLCGTRTIARSRREQANRVDKSWVGHLTSPKSTADVDHTVQSDRRAGAREAVAPLVRRNFALTDFDPAVAL